MRSETFGNKPDKRTLDCNVTCIVAVLVVRSIRRVIAANTEHLILKVRQREKHAFLSMKLTLNQN